LNFLLNNTIKDILKKWFFKKEYFLFLLSRKDLVMRTIKLLALLILAFFSRTTAQITTLEQPKFSHKVDLVIFSFDRILQLQAHLESTQKYVHNVNESFVLYRASTDDFEKAYQKLKTAYPLIKFIKQGNDPSQDFKLLLVDIICNQSTGDYILFSVDDIIVTDHIDIQECANAIEEYKADVFSCRLGKNIVESYNDNVGFPLTQPPLTSLKSHMFLWHFSQGSMEWSFKKSVDMTLYRKSDICDAIKTMPYKNPNGFELYWNHSYKETSAKEDSIGICFEYSRCINIPLNVVQQEYRGFAMGYLSAQELLEEFNIGSVIDIDHFFKMHNKSTHIPEIPPLIQQKK
jgi:hypothetical protein